MVICMPYVCCLWYLECNKIFNLFNLIANSNVEWWGTVKQSSGLTTHKFLMNKYKVLNVLGDGSFGTVMMAENSLNGENVAIKKIKKKFYTWDECLQLREVKSLRRISHTNIIKLKEVLRENDELFFIFEYMGGNLYDVEPVDFIIGDAGY